MTTRALVAALVASVCGCAGASGGAPAPWVASDGPPPWLEEQAFYTATDGGVSLYGVAQVPPICNWRLAHTVALARASTPIATLTGDADTIVSERSASTVVAEAGRVSEEHFSSSMASLTASTSRATAIVAAWFDSDEGVLWVLGRRDLSPAPAWAKAPRRHPPVGGFPFEDALLAASGACGCGARARVAPRRRSAADPEAATTGGTTGASRLAAVQKTAPDSGQVAKGWPLRVDIPLD